MCVGPMVNAATREETLMGRMLIEAKLSDDYGSRMNRFVHNYRQVVTAYVSFQSRRI